MEKSVIPVSLIDGSSTKISVFKPKTYTIATPVVVVFPAMGVAAGYYEPLGTSLAESGIITISADLRGHGHSSIRPSKTADFGYQEMINVDFRGILLMVEKQFPDNPKYILGHSLGGQLAALYLSSHEVKINGLILSACCSVYYKGWKGFGGIRILMATQFFRMLSNMLGYFPGDKVGFGGKQAKTVILDWSYQARTGIYDPENTAFDYDGHLRNLETPVLACSYIGDNLAPKAAVKHLYEKFSPNAKVTHLHLSADELGMKKVNHYKWIREPKGITKVIKDWIVETDGDF